MGAPRIVPSQRSSGLPPHDVVRGVYDTVVIEIAGNRHQCGEGDLASGVKFRSVRTGNAECAGGRDAGPIEVVNRAADLAGTRFPPGHISQWKLRN